MDKYEACKDISKRLERYNIPLIFCNKAEFASNYKKFTGLKIKEVNRILTSINKKYQIVWYHTRGFIFSYDLKTKIRPSYGGIEIDWGTYYSLFHLDYNKEFITSGGKYKGTNAIHPNIYHKEPVSNGSRIYDVKICLPFEIRGANPSPLIETGGIASFIDQVLTCVQTNDGNGLMGQFQNKAYSRCRVCGIYTALNISTCKKCEGDDVVKENRQVEEIDDDDDDDDYYDDDDDDDDDE